MPSRRRAAAVPVAAAVCIGAGFAATLGASAYAAPSRTVPLHQTGVIATDIGPADCREFPAGRRAPEQDGWIFEAPGESGRFRSAVLIFDTPAGTVNVAATGAHLLDSGHRLWLVTPHGWTLMSGTAELAQPTASGFDLASTCWAESPLAAAGAAAPGAAPVAVPAAGGTANIPITAVVDTPGSSPTSPAPQGGGQGAGGLPVTGLRLAPLALLGLALAVAGALLRRAARRRRAAA